MSITTCTRYSFRYTAGIYSFEMACNRLKVVVNRVGLEPTTR